MKRGARARSGQERRPYKSVWVPRLKVIAERSWDDPLHLTLIRRELVHRSSTRAARLQARISERLGELQEQSFKWPSSDATAGRTALNPAVFRTSSGVLRLMGYRTGINGLPSRERRLILDRLYRQDVPASLERTYRSEWGEPATGPRLKKLAETIAAFTRNAKRRRGHDMRASIAAWESDLAYLKERYYRGRYDFGWPRT